MLFYWSEKQISLEEKGGGVNKLCFLNYAKSPYHHETWWLGSGFTEIPYPSCKDDAANDEWQQTCVFLEVSTTGTNLIPALLTSLCLLLFHLSLVCLCLLFYSSSSCFWSLLPDQHWAGFCVPHYRRNSFRHDTVTLNGNLMGLDTGIIYSRQTIQGLQAWFCILAG